MTNDFWYIFLNFIGFGLACFSAGYNRGSERKKNDKIRCLDHKPVTSPTPPPSPQSYWTGKPVVPDQIRKSMHNRCQQCYKCPKK